MSDRQMARAAVDGRLVIFIQELNTSLNDGDRSIRGFLVGADDYHWMIIPDDSLRLEDGDLSVILVHKSCPFVMISGSARLGDRPEIDQKRVARIGQGFWDYCKQAHFGFTATTPQEKT